MVIITPFINYSLILLIPILIIAALGILSTRITSERHRNMSRISSSTKSKDNALVSSFREITGASASDAARIFKKHKSLEGAIEAFYSDSGAQAHASTSSGKDNGKKLGDIWERFKDPSDPKLIKIEGTMELCNELDVDPSSDPVLFCLATDLGSKATGEWEKGPWVAGWSSISPDIDSITSMKAALPKLRQKLKTDPAYFKKVYMHTFDLAKAPGARTLALETACDLWNLYIPPALTSSPSALSRTSGGPPQFSTKDLEEWIEFQKKKGKAVSRDTWSLFIDFVRSIDKQFEEYDEEAAWPSTIDDFVEHIRQIRGKI